MLENKFLSIFLILVLSVFSTSVNNASALSNPIVNSAPLLNNVSFLLNSNERKKRMINGDNAYLGQFPWQVALFLEPPYFCGGSLIDYSGWILTAAHCLHNKTEGNALIGTVSIASWTNSLKFFKNSMHIHSNYNEKTIANDIGLVKVNRITPTNHIRVISLDHRKLQPNVNVTVSGWGDTKDSDQNVTTNLKYVSLKTIRNRVCQRWYWYWSNMNDGMVCAKSKFGKSPCQGDSGGALITNIGGNNPIQVGVMSFGHNKGCELKYPTGYTRIGPFISWIHFKTRLKL